MNEARIGFGKPSPATATLFEGELAAGEHHLDVGVPRVERGMYFIRAAISRGALGTRVVLR
ncbi:MAG: hypothetical protein IH600_01555 [Bacteroidetes bacterium]|nr:hypothetical protein [Bacteroidota bacterium]